MMLYKRVASVIVGNDKIADAPNALKIDKLRVRFEIEKIAFGRLNTGNIQIFNLSNESIARIERKFTKVILNAGYVDQDVTLLLTGDILNITHARQQADTITTIYVRDGGQAYVESICNQSFDEKMSAREVFRRVASTFKDVTIGDLSLIPDQPIYIGGQTICDSTYRVLNQLSSKLGVVWQINNGKLVISKDVIEPITTYDHEFTQNNGMIGSPTITEIGINVVSLLRPDVQPLSSFRVRSETPNYDIQAIDIVSRKDKINEKVQNASCRVLNIKHIGDTHGNEWYTSCAGLFSGNHINAGIGYG